MQPYKTELGHAALQAHRAPLDLRQRRTLILCDGRRKLTELTALLGNDTPTLIAQLQHQGYLQMGSATPAPAGAPASAHPGHRRSLVAARLYLLDMLALQRNPTGQRLHQVLQAAREDGHILHALQLALAQLPAMTSAGYVQRVGERLREVLPESHLALLEERPWPLEEAT